jgi:hypothetical protein
MLTIPVSDLEELIGNLKVRLGSEADLGKQIARSALPLKADVLGSDEHLLRAKFRPEACRL